MSLLSLVRDSWDHFRPSLLLDQHFGVGLHDDDFLEPCVPRRLRRMLLAPYSRNWRSRASRRDKGSTLAVDKDKFQVSLDVQQFEPEEITVKTSGDTVTVEGRHEEKEDEHGYVSRHFVRKYTVPKGHDVGLVQSRLSSDGVLTITAPKKREAVEEREIPIAITGRASERGDEDGKEMEQN